MMAHTEFDRRMEEEQRRLCDEYGIKYSRVIYASPVDYEQLAEHYEKRVTMPSNFMSDDRRLGQAIKIARVRSGKKQKNVAELANISANYLSLVENGHRQPTLFALCDICNVIGVKTWEIIKAAEETNDGTGN